MKLYEHLTEINNGPINVPLLRLRDVKNEHFAVEGNEEIRIILVKHFNTNNRFFGVIISQIHVNDFRSMKQIASIIYRQESNDHKT